MQEFRLGQGTAAVPGTLYLRVLGQQQPYASHGFQLAAPVKKALPTTDDRVEALPESPIALNKEIDSHAAAIDQSDRVQREDGSSAAASDTAFSELTTLRPEPELPHQVDQTSLPARSSLLPWLIAGIGVSLICFGAGLWVMSRPCMVGACEPLQSAQTLSQQSLQAMQTAKTGSDLQRVQQQLTDAKRRLQEIPAWSGHHQEAEALQQTYQSQLQMLDQVLAAENKADTAAQKGQTLPQSTTSLQATQALWREAIAQLQTVPQTSTLYAFAQRRLSVYEANLAANGKLTTAEQQAQKKLVTG